MKLKIKASIMFNPAESEVLDSILQKAARSNQLNDKQTKLVEEHTKMLHQLAAVYEARAKA